MRPSEILKEKIPEIIAVMKDNEYFCNLRVFGSVANGSDTEESDIDFLVDIKQQCTYFPQFQLERELEKILGVKVDLVVEAELNPLVRRTIKNILSINGLALK